ncbi:hypothetical protein Tco_0383374 [Tanacetum coccineum]
MLKAVKKQQTWVKDLMGSRCMESNSFLEEADLGMKFVKLLIHDRMQQKGVRDPLVSKHGARDNGQHVDDLVDGTSTKVGEPSRKNGIWWSRKLESSSESGFTSPSPFNFLTQENRKSILCDLHESNDDADVENGYNEMTTLLAS